MKLIALVGGGVGCSSLVQQEIAREALYPSAVFPFSAGEKSNVPRSNF
jgi:hypothetical protein